MASRHVMDWTPTRVELLTRLWDGGFTAAEIAKRIDGRCTRSMVLGKAHRLKLKRRRPGKPIGAKRKPRQKPPQVKKPAPKPKLEAAPRPIEVKAKRPPKPQSYGKVSVLDLSDHVCRFPMHKADVPGSWMFCGEAVKENSSYCAKHHEKCHTRRFETEAA